MTYSITAGIARLQARQDLIVFDEISAITRHIITAMNQGQYHVEISNNTPMTQCTPILNIIGSAIDPMLSSPGILNIGGNLISVGVSGNNLASVIFDINRSEFNNISANFTDDLKLIIQYTCPAHTWSVDVIATDAADELGLNAIEYFADVPESTEYYQAWLEASDDRRIIHQFTSVVSHFEKLGFVVEVVENTQSQNTFKWIIYW